MKSKTIALATENIQAHELMGLRVEAERSSTEGAVKGVVVDETMNTISVQTKEGVKKLPKKECVFVFEVKGKKTRVLGKEFVARPEDRVKIFWRKKHGKK